ncbi:hypothetical protein KY289_019879 [Solanum tuberosum]|nr:hypothetical protein KY289_019879 [Solanum tuberosum]
MTSVDTTRANPRANHSGILSYPPNQAYTPTELLCQLLVKKNAGHAQSKSGIRGHDVQRRGPRYGGPSGSTDATGNAIIPYEPSCHISNERRGTKHARSSYSNPLLEEPIDFGHAPKTEKNYLVRVPQAGKQVIGWGEPNQAGFKCEPGNVVDARRELQLTGRYNNKDATLEL